MTPTPRAALDGVPLYVPKPPARQEHLRSFRLFLNENPYPPLPSIRRAISDGALTANEYPEIMPGELVAAIARRCGVPESDVVTGPGTVGIYQQIAQAMLGPGDEIVYAWPSFEAYPIVGRIAGAREIVVPLRDDVHDLPAMAGRVTSRTRVIFVCNPNNPTGTAVPPDELAAFLEAVRPDVLVVLDEAYHEFDRSGADGIELYRRHPNVVVLRTFSKAYGMAGLRVGYGIARTAISTALRKCAVPCGVSGIGVRAALAALDAEAELMARVDDVCRDREALFATLTGLGLPVPPSEANFLWLPLGAESDAVAARLESRGVLARLFPGTGIRLSIGTAEANAVAESALRDAVTPVMHGS